MARRTRAGPHQRRVSRPSAPPIAVAVVAAGGAAGRRPALAAGRRRARRLRLSLDHVRDQRGRLVRCSRLLPALAVVRRRALLALALGPGVLGGFTTLSAYAEQGRGLLADGRTALAAAYLLGTLAACLVAVALATGCRRRRAAGLRRRGGQRVTAAAGRPRRRRRGRAAVPRRAPPRRAVPVGHAAGQHGGLVPARLCVRPRPRRARAGAARRRLLRRLHDVLRLRGADPRARAGARGTAYAVATIVLALAACAVGFVGLTGQA